MVGSVDVELTEEQLRESFLMELPPLWIVDVTIERILVLKERTA
jgi:hypothetical protein